MLNTTDISNLSYMPEIPHAAKRQLVEIDLTPDERHQLKIRAVIEHSTVKEIVTKALREYLQTSLDKHVRHD